MTSATLSHRIGMLAYFLMGLCLSGVATCGYLLYLDFLSGVAGAPGRLMARIQGTAGTVRKRPASSFLWSKVKEGEPLYFKESIQVDKASSAHLSLEDGSQLRVGENSLVVLEEVEKLGIHVLRGSLVLSRQGEEKKISRESGHLSVEILSFRLIRPSPMEELSIISDHANKHPITLSWDGVRSINGGQAVLELARDLKFSKTIYSSSIDPTVREQKLGLPIGKYYWRIRNEKDPLSETRSFTVSEALPLKLLRPSQGEKILPSELGVAFRWQAPKEGLLETHFLEVAKDREFKNIISKNQVTASSGRAIVAGLPGEEMFWRMKSQTKDFELVSDSFSFQIEPIPPPVIDLLMPRAEQRLKSSKEVGFQWKINKVATEFLFQIKNKSDNKQLYQVKTRVPYLNWMPTTTGQLEWGVSALIGNETVVSPTRVFSSQAEDLTGLTPLPNSSHDLLSTPMLTFAWKGESLLDSPDLTYLFELSLDREFRKVHYSLKSREQRITGVEIPQKASSYYWRVRLVDSSSHVLSSSELIHFKTVIPLLLDPPSLIAPAIGQVIRPSDLTETPELKWNEKEGASAYEVILLHNGKILSTNEVKGNALKVKDFQEGTYSWAVSSIDQWKRKGLASQKQWFKVKFADLLPPPDFMEIEVKEMK